jgi:hypothetical protein
VRVGLPASERIGPVAQWLEPTAHNGLVGGSNPPGPTTQCDANRCFPGSLTNSLQFAAFPRIQMRDGGLCRRLRSRDARDLDQVVIVGAGRSGG